MADLSVYDKLKTMSDYQEINKQRALENQILKQKAAGNVDSPASVKEWNYYNQLAPQDQKRYIQMKRADQIMNLGGTMAVRGQQGGIMEQYAVTPKMTDMPEFQAQQESAKTEAKLMQEAETGASLGLGQAQSSADQLKAVISGLKNHPGFSAVVGFKNPLKGAVPFTESGYMSGTPAAGAQAYVDQIKGKAFLDAFQSLKGGGAITEREGTAATAAIARLNQAQSEADYTKSLNDLENIVNNALARQKARANTVNNPSLPPAFQGLPIEPSLYERGEAEFNSKKKTVNWEDLP